jgi:hypothetical protein
MDVETFKDNQAVHLEISPKATLQVARFEGLTLEEETVLEKKRECSVRLGSIV